MDGAPLALSRAGYEDDFHAWALEQVALLRAGRLSEADIEHVAEEIESLARKTERRVRSHLKVLLIHLLKWEVQPELRGRSWRSTIVEQRDELSGLLEDNPSLAARWDEHVAYAHRRAVVGASAETGLPKTRFKMVALWSREQIMSDEFMPGEAQPSGDE